MNAESYPGAEIKEYIPVKTEDPSQSAPNYHSLDIQDAYQEPEPERAPPPPRGSSFGMSEGRVFIIAGGVIVGIIALLVILLPMSFVGLEYYEFGFKRAKSTGVVDTETVFGPGGKHGLGPDGEFKVFPADAHFEKLNQVTVFASDKLQVEITVNYQYFLRPHQLSLLHKNFDIHYEGVLRNNAQDALKGAATSFSTREYIRERDRIERALFKAIRERLGGKCCEKDCQTRSECPNCKIYDLCVEGCKPYASCSESDYGLFAEVRYFQLAGLGIPDDLNQRYLRALILQEETDTEKFKQEAQIVRKETDGKVKDTENAAMEISQNATAQSNLIKSRATADATATVEKARSDGLTLLYRECGITDPEHKASFDYLRTLKSHKNVKLTVNYNQLIAGPMT